MAALVLDELRVFVRQMPVEVRLVLDVFVAHQTANIVDGRDVIRTGIIHFRFLLRA